jgi:hypothetical protein
LGVNFRSSRTIKKLFFSPSAQSLALEQMYRPLAQVDVIDHPRDSWVMWAQRCVCTVALLLCFATAISLTFVHSPKRSIHPVLQRHDLPNVSDDQITTTFMVRAAAAAAAAARAEAEAAGANAAMNRANVLPSTNDGGGSKNVTATATISKLQLQQKSTDHSKSDTPAIDVL